MNLRFHLPLRVFLAAGMMAHGALAGVPGDGFVVDALSDEFEEPWSYDHESGVSSNGLWYSPFRGAPEVAELADPPGGAVDGSARALRLRSIDDGDDDHPGMEDLVAQFPDSTVFGGFLEHADGPSVVAWLHFPPIEEWPLGTHSFGFRVAARDSTLVSSSNEHGEYYPSLWTYRGTDGRGYLMIRIGDGISSDFLIAQFSSGGWYTFGIAWDDAGQTEYYAAAGRVTLTPDDLFYTDTASGRVMELLAYNFFSLRFPPDGALSPEFLVDRCRVSTTTPPVAPVVQLTPTGENAIRVSTSGGTPGFSYRLERSGDLTPNSWEKIGEFLNHGGTVDQMEETGFERGFYRLVR